jgi:hypothetical protein
VLGGYPVESIPKLAGKMSAPGSPWTAADDEKLISLKSPLSITGLMAEFGSIPKLAGKMSAPGSPWTAADDDKLISLKSSRSITELMAEFGRDEGGILARLARLKHLTGPKLKASSLATKFAALEVKEKKESKKEGKEKGAKEAPAPSPVDYEQIVLSTLFTEGVIADTWHLATALGVDHQVPELCTHSNTQHPTNCIYYTLHAVSYMYSVSYTVSSTY